MSGTAAPVLDVWIPGQPVPKGRPRVTRNGKPYTPRRTRVAEDAVRWFLAGQPIRRLEGSLRVEFNFFRRTRRKVDGDNLQKLVQDAGNDLVWVDDSQIVDSRVTVELGVALPGTRLRVWELR